MCCHKIVSYIRLDKQVQMLSSLTHLYIQLIRDEVISKLPKFPGLQEDPHHEVFLSFFMSLPWADQALSRLRYVIFLRLRLSQSYRPIG